MEFNPASRVIQTCLQGIAREEQGQPAEAARLFRQAWNEANDDFEKFIVAYFVARHQPTAAERLQWLQTALQSAQKTNNEQVKSAFPALYAAMAKSYDDLGDPANAKQHTALARSFAGSPADKGPFYHGTRADLGVGDLLMAGNRSNYRDEMVMNHIYFTGQVNGAGLAAAFAKGEGRERVYVVEPTGSFEHDPNVTDKKFPGNLTRSYRSLLPLKIVGEVTEWVRPPAEVVQKWREKFADGEAEIIN